MERQFVIGTGTTYRAKPGSKYPYTKHLKEAERFTSEEEAIAVALDRHRFAQSNGLKGKTEVLEVVMDGKDEVAQYLLGFKA